MKKLSIIRFKPNLEHCDEFTRTLREFLDQRTREGVEHTYVMTKDDEVFSDLPDQCQRITIGRCDYSSFWIWPSGL